MNRGRLQPYWTASETSMLVGLWRDLESSLSVNRVCRRGVPEGLDVEISTQLSRRSKTVRSLDAVQTHRHRIYKFIRLIRGFDNEQQVSGGRFWFDLSEEEQKQVKMPQVDRRMSSILTRDSVNKLMTVASVKTRTKPRKTTSKASSIQRRSKKHRKASFYLAPMQKFTEPRSTTISGHKTGAEHDNYLTSKCNSCWSDLEVLGLVRAWGQVLKRLQISVDTFAKIKFELAADLYTPQGRSAMSAWRKMKRIVFSYQFIQNFNAQHSLTQWFELSDAAQNEQIDWGALPEDFEDMSRDIFDEIQCVDSSLSGESSIFSDPLLESEAQSTGGNSSTSVGIEDIQGSVQLQEAIALCTAELCKGSPHVPDRKRKNLQLSSTSHRECNALLESMVKLQSNQLHQAVHRLHGEVDRILRRSTEALSKIFFDKFGQPGKAGNASFIEKLLKGHHQRIREHFDCLEEEFDSEQIDRS